jgi:hemolysin activation/secretion protein
MDLPALGWDQFGRSGRGYTQGRFRGEDIFYTEVELRMPLHLSKKHPNRYGYTLFTNVTSTSDRDRDEKFLDHFEFGAGVGFRYLLNKKSRAYLALDLAVAENKKTSFYLNINEAF